jgi:SAM-dependent methyltransferase
MTDAVGSGTVNNPFFARLWSKMSTREPESIRRLRRENLAGLTGRVLEVGAGTGTNFEFYPASVTEVVAIEPEQRLAVLARDAADKAAIPVTVSVDTVERYAPSATGEPFDAVVCSLVLCSVDDPADVLRQLFSALRPGGELRYLEHVASAGPRARMQRLADATVWPWLLGNCHTQADRAVDRRRRVRGGRSQARVGVACWVPVPVSETAIGRAVKPA